MNVMSSLKALIHNMCMFYVRFICAKEYKKQACIGINERPIEFAFLFRHLVELWPKTILDVGTGMTALPHLMRNCGFMVTASDNIKDYWPAGMHNRHYHVINDDITKTQINQKFDVITCVSVLEHIHDHRSAMRSMYRLLNSGGRLILTCPYNEKKYNNNVYKLPESSVTEEYPFITQAFSREEVESWLSDSPFELIDQEFWKFFTGDYWTCGSRVMPPQKNGKKDLHQLSCLAFTKPSGTFS
jgi:2-polyprenyl-3-methyl-5-hydroxy-6-metoxy-1,4-benzoquinol methylase